ncbi:hypothetical protein F5148DRAFT_1285672 [Russula earlei]|uniref:Uncharacterized protein n=1 Tax=Russula earlei TaxID=71964 RepID=A0ACC0U870_9AGAM|nr:hypothetical protein F5148DRAFT_1285672 [Russula earlei]
MANFSDLPLEILLDIIDSSLEPDADRDHRHRFVQLSNLSLVCRFFHSITIPKIFSKYRLQLRELGGGRDAGCSRSQCFLTATSLLTWCERGFHARLDHLRKRAAFVRELRIVDLFGQPPGDDHRTRSGGEPAPFDSALLLETLDTLNRVVSVTFEGTKQRRPPARFPAGLWQWLARLRPESVSFDACFAFPPLLEPLPSVRSMSLLMSREATGAIEAVRSANLDLTLENADVEGTKFKELLELYPTLERLDVRVCYRDWMPPGYFDFTSHPETQIAIHMTVTDVEAYIEAPGAWNETEERLKEAFVDDFTGLDVRRDDGSGTFVVSRPPRGQTGGIRDLHLPESDEDKEAILAFEQAILATLSGRGPFAEPTDAAFWAHLEDVFATAYFQTIEPLVRA